jgi:type II secretory pathway component GspD/PulD (secretin)
VVAFFADYADRSIVLGTGVTGTVTAEIQRQRWDLALEAILRAHGLYARELESGIILVENPGATAETPPAVATRVFRLNYTPAAEMQAVVQSMLSEGGTASVLPSINALVVTDAPDVLDRVAALLR